MKVPKLSWALLILAMGCMIASWGVGIFSADGVKDIHYKLLQGLWLNLTLASAAIAAGAALAYGITVLRLRSLRTRIARMLSRPDGLDDVKEYMAGKGWAYSETGGAEGDKTWTWTNGRMVIALKGTSRTMKVGDRVTAFVCTNARKRTLDLLGHGVFAGRFPPPPEWHMPSGDIQIIRIDLDSGQSVWGPQCWWGTCEHVAAQHPQPEWTWIQVDVNAFIGEWNAARLKDWQEEQANAEPQAPAEAAPSA